MSIRPLKWILLGPVSALLLLANGFAEEGAVPLGADPLLPSHEPVPWRQSLGRCTDPPPGQPAQIKSQVNYDPKLSDPFFETGKWSDEMDEECGTEDHLKHKARCLSSLDFEHVIHFCNAKLLYDGSILICIHETGPSADEHFGIVVENKVFWSQYWYVSIVHLDGDRRTWTTKNQKLTLDKQVYHKGDVIKGKIYFKCLEDETNPKLVEKFGLWPYPITIKGVFKTILE
ncbi:MAG: hypothetical protein ACLP5H_28600 [Desulfomonilaceae bacterium]